MAEQRGLHQKAEAALAAARAQLARLLPIEAELQRERRERQATAAQVHEELAVARRQAEAALEAQAQAEAQAEAEAECHLPSSPVISRHPSSSSVLSRDDAALPSPSSVMVALTRREMAREMTGDAAGAGHPKG